MKKEYITPAMKVVAVRTERVILNNTSDSIPIGGKTDETKAWSKEECDDDDFDW